MAQQRRRGKKPGCWVRKSFYVSAEYKSFKTYQELKKNLKSLIEENTVDDNEVTITRTRRGEWGEWFEKWRITEGKPEKFKEGWL
ncbi:MAG TPA: hypothetical protein VIH28_06935 [Ignavibacteriaceae bacterium]